MRSLIVSRLVPSTGDEDSPKYMVEYSLLPFPAYVLAGATGFTQSLDGSTQPRRLIATAGRKGKESQGYERIVLCCTQGDGVVGDIVLVGAMGWKNRTLVFRGSGMVIPASILFYLFCLQYWS